jgi:hypothetical protein
VVAQMGYFCSLCKKQTNAENIMLFLQHFHAVHALKKYDRVNILCHQDDCMKTLESLSAFGKHLNKYHRSFNDCSMPVGEGAFVTCSNLDAVETVNDEGSSGTTP